jgi:hypothetical protein
MHEEIVAFSQYFLHTSREIGGTPFNDQIITSAIETTKFWQDSLSVKGDATTENTGLNHNIMHPTPS